eukprot:12183327-Ditylum_brightwellii.AAC.1
MEIEFLTPEGWHEWGHGMDGGAYHPNSLWYPHIRPGTHIWEPALAATSADIEELRKACHKRQESTHIILIPRRMGPEWQQALNKATDFLVEIP